eukprot:scaffold31.g3791.t1
MQAAQVSKADPGRTGDPTSANSAVPDGQQEQNGVTPLIPLVPPGEAMFEAAKQMISPFTPEQIEKLHGTLDQNRRAMAAPSVQTMPELRNSSTRAVDYRLDLRVPGRGPNAQEPIVTQDQIALYDNTMQAFLDGVPPQKARTVKIVGDSAQRTQAWQLEGTLYLRTALGMETAFDQTIGAADGTRVYKLAPTPFVMLSELGHPLQLQLDID